MAHIQGSVSDYDSEELKRLDLGQGERIPELKDVVKVVTAGNKGLIMEIKGITEEDAINVEVALSEFLEKSMPKIPVYACSFWHKTIEKSKTKNPNIKAFILIEDKDSAKKSVELVYNADADGAGIKSDYISKEIVDELHSRNLFIDAWVVNDVGEFERLKGIGVDWITTDYPDRFGKKVN
jgi:glycerophosphoryl diester phosphodiesterase